MANGLVVVHGGRSHVVVDRLALLARKVAPGLGRCEASAVDGDALEVVLGEQEPSVGRMEGTERYLVLHVVDGKGSHVPDVVATLTSKLGARWPTLVIRQWVVQLVDREYEADEMQLAHRVRAEDTGLHGLLVVGSAGEASAAHTDEEMCAVAADAGFVLLASHIEASLSDAPEVVWAAGATSVTYRREALAESIGAYLGWRYVADVLLAQRPANDVSFGLGESWASRLGLDEPELPARLRQSPDGGSVAARLQMEPMAFDTVPVEAWPDRIASYHDHLLTNRLPRAEVQIEANLVEQLDGLIDDAERSLASLLREATQAGVIDQAQAFCQGATGRLEELQRRLQDERNAVAAAKVDVDEPLHRLEESIRRLPYRAAAAVRAVVIAALGAVMVAAAADRAGDPGAGLVLAVSALVGAAIWGGWTVYGTWRAVLRRRRELIDAISDHLRWILDLVIVEAQADLVARLMAHIGAHDAEPAPPYPKEAADPTAADRTFSMQARVARLRSEAVDAAQLLDERQQGRTEPGLGATRFALSVPHHADQPTADLARDLSPQRRQEAVDAILNALFARSWSPPSSLMVAACSDAGRRFLSDQLPVDLTEVLSDESSRSRSVEVLGRDASSLVRHADRAGRDSMTIRFLAIGGGDQAGVESALDRQVGGSLLDESAPRLDFKGGRHVHEDENIVLALHLIPLDHLFVDEVAP